MHEGGGAHGLRMTRTRSFGSLRSLRISPADSDACLMKSKQNGRRFLSPPRFFTPAVLSVSELLENDRPLISLFGEGQYQSCERTVRVRAIEPCCACLCLSAATYRDRWPEPQVRRCPLLLFRSTVNMP